MVSRLFSTSQKIISRKSSSILSAASIITGASFLSALLGLVRNRLLVSRFFATEALKAQLDAYLVAFRIPELVFQLLVIGAMSAAFIPVYSKYKEKSEEEANRMAASILNVVVLAFVAISVVIFIGAESFNTLITSSNFSIEQIHLSASITRVMLLAQLFFAASSFMSSMIQAHQRFLLPALSPLAYNLGIILGIVFLTPTFGIYGPAWGVVLGAFLHLLIQLPLAIKLGFRPEWKIAFKHPGVREVFRLMPPRMLAVSVDQIELLVSAYFTTGLQAGSLAMLSLAQQLMNAPNRIFSVPIGQASLPFLSKEAARNQWGEFKKTLSQTLNQVLFLAMPASAIILILRIPLVRLAYGAAEFPWAATLLTGKLVALFALSIFAYGGIHVLTRAYYALHDTKTPFLVALFGVIISTSLMIASSHWTSTGVLGIGAAISFATLLQFSLLFSIIVIKYQAIDLKIVGYSQIRVFVASLVMGVSLWVPMRLLDKWVFDTTRTVPLILLTAVVCLLGGATFIGLSKLFAIPELQAFTGIYRKLGKWKSILSESEEAIEITSQTEEVKPW